MTDRFGRRLQPSLTLSLTPIAAACAALFAWTPASAQTSNEDTAQAGAPVQTVVVTGIRRGIEEAISVKKNAESIVEAISAEDIGKLPDASIAESIARLPGVTAQRFKGRAQAVSIRGMSPDFSTALLNGREQVSTGDSRGVEFDQYPAELLAGVVIYKTPDAALVGQGLSGTTDMQTVRPLDFGQRTVALNARAVRSGLGTEEHGNGSRFSASYIDQFAGRTVGLALGYARLNDTPHTSRFVSWGAGTAQYQGKTVDVPYNGIEAWSGTDDDKRDGVMAVLQVRPSRDFNSTLDLFYSRYDHRGTDHGLLFPLNDSYVPRSSLTDQPGALIRAELDGNRVVAGTFDNVRGVVQNRGEYAVEKTKSVGWKSTARFSPDWTGSLDLSYNKATRTDSRAESYAGAYGAGGTAALDEVTFSTRDFGFGAHLNYADPSIMRLSDVLGWGGSDIQAAYLRNSEVSDRIKAVRLSARRTLGDGLPFSDVEAGVNVSDRSKQRGFMEFLGRIKGGGNDRAAALPMPDPQVGPAGESGLSILYFDPYAVGQRVFDYTEKRDPYIYNKDWTVREKVDTAYVRANIGTEVAGIGVHGNVGLQVIRTDQSSQALSVDQNGGTSDRDRPVHAVEAGTTYTDVLPSLNLGFDLGSQQTVRFALAKVMARPTLSDMRASNQFSVDRTRNIYTGSGGNPGLSPFR
ncbi:MAG: TonB-dependent receptor, partial [Gammaproteobacteria bacterium]